MQTPGPIRTQADLAAYARRLADRRQRRQRRRLAALAGMLVLGLALGTVWASGFATTGGATNGAASADPDHLYMNPGNTQDTSGLNGLITPGGPLSWTWQGQWGSVASIAIYTLDLDGESTGDDFFAEVLLTNLPTGFADLQLELRIKDDGPGGTCTPTDIDNVADTDDYRIFTFETNDAQVTFAGMNGAATGLPGGSTYCIGIANYSGSGQDPEGTFIRKSTKGPSFNGQLPTFVATLNQME